MTLFPNSVPIPDFSSAIPLPTNSSALGSTLGVGQGSTSRKSKDNQRGVFNLPCRSFSVPLATQESTIHKKIYNALLHKHLKRNRIENNNSNNNNKIGKSSASRRNKSQEQSKDFIQMKMSVKKVAKLSKESQIILEVAEQKAAQCRQELLDAIRQRDQELKVATNMPSSSKDDKIIQEMNSQKEELLKTIKKSEVSLKEVEETWEKDKEKQLEITREVEERKRKATEQIEEQQRKKQKFNIEAQTSSDSQKLERELKVRSCTTNPLYRLLHIANLT